MLNKVILIGKVQEVQVTFTDEGLARLVLTVRTWQGKNSEFHRVVFFDPTVEKAYKYYEILKDKNYNGYVYIEGRLNYRTFQGQDGIKRRIVSIIARQIKFISPPANGHNGHEGEKSEEPSVVKTEDSEKLTGQTIRLQVSPATSNSISPEARTEKPEPANEVNKPQTSPAILEPIDDNKILEELEAFEEDDIPF